MCASIQASTSMDVQVTSVELRDMPAQIQINVNVNGTPFFSRITYHSIPNWQDIWRNLGASRRRAEFLGALVAWDCMRFLTLGGSRLILCDGLALGPDVRASWRHCFLNQFGEWRHRNGITYASGAPCITAAEPEPAMTQVPLSEQSCDLGARWLLTNGGGKDTLVGMLLLNRSGMSYDVYEGTLPLGGRAPIQRGLLGQLREACAPTARLVEVTIEDNFFDAPKELFSAMGVETLHYLADFAVGHTANYVGYFPIILHHRYVGVWFNIEASADRVMAMWNDEAINHQWCKSQAYQEICSSLFGRLTYTDFFTGFSSTLRGLHDSLIYAIAAPHEDLLRKTHSCNIAKPWCTNCPKCTYSYLMISSFKGEAFAQSVMGLDESLFSRPQNRDDFRDLLDPSRVAWECVPSHFECREALVRCQEAGIDIGWLTVFNSPAEVNSEFRNVNWPAVPQKLRGGLISLMGEAKLPVEVDVVVIGAGQTGLGMSAVLSENGIRHLVLDASEVGASWQKRWDSFRLNTPNRTLALPNYRYAGPDPDGFLAADEVVALLRSYAHAQQLPIVQECPVIEVTAPGDGFMIATPLGWIGARSLVVAAGEYSAPRSPQAALESLSGITLLHSSEYRSPGALPAGAVLVVGGGQSGAQIVEDMLDAGRTVYWSISDRPSNIRRLRGKDFMEWWDIGGIIHRHVSQDPDVVNGMPDALRRARSREFPLVSGKGDGGKGRSISLLRLAECGVTLLGKFESISNGLATFRDVRPQIERSVAGTRREFELLSGIADTFFRGIGLEVLHDDKEFIPKELLVDWAPEASPLEIDLTNHGVTSVILATGFGLHWPWLTLPGIFDEHGYPLGYDGLSPHPGLFFMGLFNIQRLSSTCLCNGGRDADTLLPLIKARIGGAESASQERTAQPFLRTVSAAGPQTAHL